MFRTASKVISFFGKNAWLLILAVAVFLIERYKTERLSSQLAPRPKPAMSQILSRALCPLYPANQLPLARQAFDGDFTRQQEDLQPF